MISALILIAWLVGTVVVTALVALAVLFYAYRARVPGLAAQARSARYVIAYDDALQWLGVGYRERGRLTRDLRVNIADAAADAAVVEVLARMGPAKELARGVAARRRGPAWVIGGLAALVAIVAQVAATILMQMSFLAAVEEVAAPYQTVSSRVLAGLTFEATMGDAGAVEMFSSSASFGWLLVPLLAFLVWSRAWRVLTTKRARRVAEI